MLRASGTVKWFAPELGQETTVASGRSNWVALAAVGGLLALVGFSVVIHRRLDQR